VHYLGVLDHPGYEVSFAELERMNFLAMVASHLLLVDSSSDKAILRASSRRSKLSSHASFACSSLYYIILGASYSMSVGNTASAP
jgi:hypothetical protein